MDTGMGHSAEFDISKFLNPDSFFWPGFMWVWNDRLDVKELFLQLDEMSEVEAKSVLILPVPKNFRPETMPTQLEPEYLSEEYLQILHRVVRKIQDSEMKLWLYDEGGWPSGSVCGRIVKENPDLAQQRLEKYEIKPPQRTDSIDIPADCISAFAYRDKCLIKQLLPGERMPIDSDDITIDIYHIKRDITESESKDSYKPHYPDLLNPKTTREFIRLTHEKYKEVLSGFFGNTIPLVFTDEPAVSNPPWTDGMADDFMKSKGYDLLANLPAIFTPVTKEDMQVRIDFFDWWSARFAEAYFGQLQQWCGENGLLSAGHLNGDNDTIGAITGGNGHILRILRKLDIPGIDTIWRQIFPGERQVMEIPFGSKTHSMPVNANHHFPKFASTVAHQGGKRWALTESFCVYGSGLSVEQMKWITNFQYVRGINLLTAGLRQFSEKGHFMAGERPLFSPHNPMWQYLDFFHCYTARLSYILSLGSPVTGTALYFPVRDIWAGGQDIHLAAESNDRLAEALLEKQCDFDFIDDDILEPDSTRINNCFLEVGPMKYHTVCISRSEWMSEKAKQKLSGFAASGGKVLQLDCGIPGGRAEDFTVVSLDELKASIEPLVKVQPENRKLRVCKRRIGGNAVYFITNESLHEIKCSISFNENKQALQMDPQTGECWKLPNAYMCGDGWSVPVVIPFAGSCIYYFSDDEAHTAPSRCKPGEMLLSLDKDWYFRKRKSYGIGQDQFEVETIAEEGWTSAEPGDWRPKLGEDFSGDVEYEVNFKCSGEICDRAHFLDLGIVKYACRVYLNGELLGKRVWQPFSFVIKDRLKEGGNRLNIVVTNTIANQYVTTKVLDKWHGNILGPYHAITLLFERESLASGLYGPAGIYGAE